MQIKNYVLSKKVSLLIIGVGIVVYLLLTHFLLGGFRRVDLQPGLLVTLLEGEGGTLGIVLESDIVVRCLNNYELRATSEITSAEILINIDGLYKYNSNIQVCRSQRRRPLTVIEAGKIDNNSRIALIFTLGDRVNKYFLVMENNKLKVEPRDGGFTTIIAYEQFSGLLERYSEKYKRNYYEEELVNGKRYFTY